MSIATVVVIEKLPIVFSCNTAKEEDGSLSPLPKPNVDFGGGLERLLTAVENQPDVFQTNLLAPIISAVEKQVGKSYKGNETSMRIISDHLVAAIFYHSRRNSSFQQRSRLHILRWDESEEVMIIFQNFRKRCGICS